ncbi:MAG: hypothetical protein FWE98_02480 [Oscillospiraceae bacterium]|nr:hypothetical protein [Oscillospiraceae bacterium]
MEDHRYLEFYRFISIDEAREEADADMEYDLDAPYEMFSLLKDTPISVSTMTVARL